MSLIVSLQRLQNEVDQVVLETLNSAFPLLDLAIENYMNLGTRPKTGNATDKVYVNTGRLKQSFTVGASESIQNLKVGSNGVELTYGTLVPYAQWNEEGTKRMKARPFLAPAILEFFENDLKTIEDDIQEGLRRIFL